MPLHAPTDLDARSGTAGADHPLAPYDAVLLASFGGPEGPDDVLPFLRNVTRGAGIPDERLAQVGAHYALFGGRSPINDQNRALQAALVDELRRRGLGTPVLWGNRNWAPYTADVLREAAAGGARRVLALVTSAYASYSGCRQYREHFFAAVQEAGGDVVVDKVRPYFNHPGFRAATTDAVLEALEQQPGSHLVFVTHSIPTTMDEASAVSGATYREQHLDVVADVLARVRARTGEGPGWDLAYCSRSGPPSQPWLEPDVNDLLGDLARRGVRRVVLAPIGFVSDHMEVVYDLDTEAVATARELGLEVVRADTVGVRPAFVAGLVDLLLERAATARADEEGVAGPDRAADGALPAWRDVCRAGCCRRRAGEDSGRPAACGDDPMS